MSTLSFSTDFNVGGIQTIQLAPFYGLTSINPVVFKTGYSWDTVDFLPESAYLNDDQQDSENGTIYTYSLTFGFNKKNTLLYSQLRKYVGLYAIALLTDNNGVNCLVGTLTAPLQLKLTGATGKKFTDENHVMVDASVQLPVECVLY